MKFPDYKPQEIEPEIERYWATNKTNEKTREKNKKGKKFYFLDGPPYTSGRLHLAHAWNYSLKDMAVRYWKMKGFNVWDRNGFDMHGLPTELKVTHKHNLKTKEDILKFGLDKFILECLTFSKEMAALMTKDLKRLGISLNLENPYMPITKEFMEGEWWLIKKAHEQNRLYYGEKVMTWCQNCETALAKHECEYENVKEDSIFVKFPVKGKKKEFLIVWTTTPWTMPFNLAVMVNPELQYVRAKVDDEVWILSQALAGPVVQAVANKTLKILEEFKGEKLEGLEYIQPWEEEIPTLKELKKKQKNVFTVILNEKYVDTTAGTGLVHCAPGCGPEDQEACQPYKILPFNRLDEKGFFSPEMGHLAGLRAKYDDKKFIELLKKKKNLIEITQVEHEYPHCWRCHLPVVFRTTFQWFLKIEDIKEKMLKNNEEVNWVPETANNAFKSWVSNLKDNSISRQRFWGTPLPIWECSKCKKFDVFGSLDELKKKANKTPKDMHLPWIDEISYKCSCGGLKKRVPDIIDVWVDSGTASWNCLNNDPKLIKKFFPADFVLEAKEQTRLWFSLLSICSQIAFQKNCYKNVYAHGMLTDIEGKKMSKSLGNIVSPYELIDKHSVDVLRYYMCQNDAGKEINFSWEECAVKDRQLRILWNLHKFLIDLAKENKTNPFELDKNLMEKHFALEEKYIFSKLHQTIKKVTELFNQSHLDETIKPIEELFLELSRTYIQMIREKSALGSKEEKEVCLYTTSQVLFNCLKLFAPITPFITEAIYLNFKEEFNLKRGVFRQSETGGIPACSKTSSNEWSLTEESIHHCSWPKLEENHINLKLEENLLIAQNVIQAALSLREKTNLGVRWPIKEIVVVSKDKDTTQAIEKLKSIIETQVNVKEINIMEKLPGISWKIKADYAKVRPTYGELTPKIIARLITDSPETVLKHIEEENVYKFEIEGKTIEIKKEHLTVESLVPAPYVESQFKGGFVYLNQERNLQLDGEGYARETMRAIQQFRKDAGLEKKDRVVLFLKVSRELQSMITKFKSDIKEKVGADKLEIETFEPKNQFEFSNQKKIKKEEIKVWFDKVD